MKYLVVNDSNNVSQKCYIGITLFGGIQEGVMYPSSFVLHLEEGLICEISSEFYEDTLNKFLSNNTFIDVTEYISQEKAIVVNLSSMWDDDEEEIDDDGEVNFPKDFESFDEE